MGELAHASIRKGTKALCTFGMMCPEIEVGTTTATHTVGTQRRYSVPRPQQCGSSACHTSIFPIYSPPFDPYLLGVLRPHICMPRSNPTNSSFTFEHHHRLPTLANSSISHPPAHPRKHQSSTPEQTEEWHPSSTSSFSNSKRTSGRRLFKRHVKCSGKIRRLFGVLTKTISRRFSVSWP